MYGCAKVREFPVLDGCLRTDGQVRDRLVCVLVVEVVADTLVVDWSLRLGSREEGGVSTLGREEEVFKKFRSMSAIFTNRVEAKKLDLKTVDFDRVLPLCMCDHA